MLFFRKLGGEEELKGGEGIGGKKILVVQILCDECDHYIRVPKIHR